LTGMPTHFNIVPLRIGFEVSNVSTRITSFVISFKSPQCVEWRG
jgi:hypothetical protein